ncbi:MAG TPA: hypothetical protein VHE12_01340 [bacterium]|nr:hypothetical protein [bacterium]
MNGKDPVLFKDLAQRILALPPKGSARWVAVDGCAGAGKSSFARDLSRSLSNAPIVPLDDFLAWDDLTDFWPRFEREVVLPLSRGLATRYQARDWEKDPMGRGLGPFKTVPIAPFYILEGIGASRREMRDRLHFSVWIETPQGTRLERGLARDGEGMRETWEKWQILEGAFFQWDGARDRADLQVDGTRGMADGFWTA